MKVVLLASALMLGLFAAGTAPARDEPAAATRDDAIYGGLAETIFHGFDHEAVMERMLERVLVATLFMEDEDLRRVLSAMPDFPALIAEEMAPASREIMASQDARYRAELQGILADHLTPAEADGMQDFLTSPAGHEIMKALSRNYGGEREMYDVISGNGVVGLESTAGDWEEAWQRSVAGLSPETASAMAAATREQTWPSRILAIKPHFFVLDNRHANEGRTEQEDAELSRIMLKAVERAGERLKERYRSDGDEG